MGQVAWASEINSRLTSSQLYSGYSTPKILQYNRLCGMGRDPFKTYLLLIIFRILYFINTSIQWVMWHGQRSIQD